MIMHATAEGRQRERKRNQRGEGLFSLRDPCLAVPNAPFPLWHSAPRATMCRWREVVGNSNSAKTRLASVRVQSFEQAPVPGSVSIGRRLPRKRWATALCSQWRCLSARVGTDASGLAGDRGDPRESGDPFLPTLSVMQALPPRSSISTVMVLPGLIERPPAALSSSRIA